MSQRRAAVIITYAAGAGDPASVCARRDSSTSLMLSVVGVEGGGSENESPGVRRCCPLVVDRTDENDRAQSGYSRVTRTGTSGSVVLTQLRNGDWRGTSTDARTPSDRVRTVRT